MKNNLSRYRKSMKLTLQQVAHMAGTSKSYVWDVEQGKSTPSVLLAYALSSAVGEEVQTVFPDSNDYNDHWDGQIRSVVRYGK